MSIGFGLEHVGLWTLKHPRVAGILVLIFTVICLAQFPRVSVDGDLLRIFSGSGEYFDRYERLKDTFGTFENDAYILVKTPKLRDPATIERLRDLAFDLELNEFATGTMSPFSLRKPGPNTTSVPAVPENMQSEAEVERTLTDLRDHDPLMKNLIFSDLSGMVMIMFPVAEASSGKTQRDMIASLRKIVDEYNSPDITVELTGPPIWTSEMLDASIADQAKFSIFGFAIGGIISLIALRSFWGAILATLTPAISVIWVVGTVIMVFGSFTFLTNIVTTLVLVIAFAESMYFCFTWLRLWNDGWDPEEALEETVRRVSPAAALATMTTMVSFGTLIATAGKGIEEFGFSGLVAVGMAFIVMITFMPLALRFALRLGFKAPKKVSIAVAAPIPFARWLAMHAARPMAILSVIIIASMAYPHLQMQPSFSFEDFLPRGSESLQTARGIDSGVGGVAPIYIRVPLHDSDPNITDADFERVQKVHAILQKVIGDGKVISGASLFEYADSGFTREEIFNAVGLFLKRRFITDDGSEALVTGFLPTVIPSAELERIVNQTESALKSAGFDDTEVGGYRLMTTFASTNIIRSMQNSLVAAIIINIGLIGLAFRSWKIGLLSIIPNMFPILGTETYLYFSGAGLQLTTVISLTIAFGIAVDDTIHFLSTYIRQRNAGHEHKAAVDLTLERVGPALVATTLIICTGSFVVIFSALPQVALFGTLLVLTLVLALVGDLFILPSLLVSGGRFFNSLGGVKK